MRQFEIKLFVRIFFVVIGLIPFLQALHELREESTIQALHPLEDTFITPFKRKREIGRIADKLEKQLLPQEDERKNGVVSVTGDPERVEEALALAEDIRRTVVKVNRHIDDSSGSMVVLSDTLVAGLQLLYDEILDEVPLDERDVKSVFGSIDRIRDANSAQPVISLFTLPIKNFFRYTIFSSKYLRAYEKVMEDRSIAVNSIRPVFQFIRYALLRDVGSKAIRGRDGWLFYRPGVEYLYRPSVTDKRARSVDYNDKPLMDDPVAVIEQFRNQLAEFGVDLLVVIVPAKPSIYPDMLAPPDKFTKDTSFSRSIEMIGVLRDKGVKVVDLFGPFLEERRNDSRYGDSLYLKRDTHWKHRGLRVTANVVAERVKRYPWFNEEHLSREYGIDSLFIERVGDIGVMTKLPDFRVGELRMGFPVEKTRCFQVFSLGRNSEGEITSRNIYRDEYRKSRILVLGDSFSRIYQTDEPRGAGWISHLAYELSEPLASLVNDGGASTLVRQALSRKVGLLKGKKLVIWEFVERDFRFGAEGWKEVPLER